MDDEVDGMNNEYEDQEYPAESDNAGEAIPERLTAPSSVDIIGTVDIDGTFACTLRAVLEDLVWWARGSSLPDTGEEFRPVTLGYWHLLQSISVEFLVSLFVRGVPQQVQALFEKKEWSSEDLLSLPPVGDDKRQGVYANIATGDIDFSNRAGCEVYVGSSSCLKDRARDHLSIARNYTNRPLPNEHVKSLHYRQICREGVQSNFRKLAAFDVSIEHGYLMLLEGVFMVLLNTYQLFRNTSRFATAASYRLAAQARLVVEIPTVAWHGLNAAWPPSQGFYNKGARSASPCHNPVCNSMTWPKYLRPEGAPKAIRQTAEIGNPKRLRTPEELERFLKTVYISEARSAGGVITCDHCKVTEGDPVCRGKKHLNNRDLGQVLCYKCDFYHRDRKEHCSQGVIQTRKIKLAVDADRKAGRPILCSNCNAVEGSEMLANKKLFHVGRESSEILCPPCNLYYSQHKKHRDREIILYSQKTQEVKYNRKNGVQVVCEDCGNIEGSSGHKHGVRKDPPRILCRSCLRGNWQCLLRPKAKKKRSS
ncbi:hypothetical protein ASPBRDRAFT_672396 [Aspergillus brasiliensis CBS 101740]|uniref:Uncharacterized protein n=1 Tax=Aspergillus brasiliensis (strain CBS 101740 / IMI 381727 / IBT 21946) TaxID=767769 RepID=A0A1L9UL22_ASPBC|nr:hypothetical protein ASPBRDRAFT_672396 [Aspergillus brasiliensis CBS 101740]